MPVRLAQFYAFVLLLICLATNVVFFSEVRIFFLGDDDPLVSAQSAFAELDIAAKIAAFYPAVSSKAEEVTDEITPEPEPDSWESLLPEISAPEPIPPESLPAEPALWEELPVPSEPEMEPTAEELPSVGQIEPSAESPQIADVDSVPQPVVAVVRPVIADQFKPIITNPMPPVH